MRYKKFVLDTNIWISYFITRKENELIDIIINNELIVYCCDELLYEIRHVLNYKNLKKYNINTQLALQVVQKSTIHFALKQPIKKYLSTDENDNYIIALALQTNSGFITSGDNDILGEKDKLQKRFKKLKILTKTEFQEMYPAN